MNRMLINAAQAEELRVALVQDRSLYDLIVESAGFEQKVGNVYKARITSIEPSLDAIFVDYGSERHGFLPVKEIARHYFHNPPNNPQERVDIKKSLRIGQELMIQVEKEERGNKGAALTTLISLAGSYLVLMPNNPRAGGISRRIEGDERDELRESLSQIEVPEDMGVIVRTAGVGKSGEELKWDLDVLISHWDAIQKASEQRSAPFLIHQEGDIVIRAIRDYLRPDISELILDNKALYDKAVNHIKLVRPDFLDRVKFYERQEPLFTHFGIEQQIETAYKRTVHLRSGGSIVIDHTEALVAIDINSAGSTKGQNIEQTALNTNLEAAEEIARQLRLRDIGGLIVIDFIDMMQFKHQREVEGVLLKSLNLDRARVQISKISRFGMLEMSRQRLRPSLRETIQNVCPTCNGHGSVRSVESIALTILRIIEEEAIKPNSSEVQVQASVDTATFLLNEKRDFLNHIEQHYNTTVFVVPNPNFQQHSYDIKRLRRVDPESSGQRHKPSYSHLESPEHDVSTSKQANERRPTDQPAVKRMTPARPEDEQKSGIFKRLMSSVFGSNDDLIDAQRNEQPASSPRQPSDDRKDTRSNNARGNDRQRDTSNRSNRSNDRNRSNIRDGNSDSDRANRGRGQQDRRSQSHNNRNRADASRGNRNTSDGNRNRNDTNNSRNRGHNNKNDDNSNSNRNVGNSNRNVGHNNRNVDNSNSNRIQPDNIGNRVQSENSGNHNRNESGRHGNSSGQQQRRKPSDTTTRPPVSQRDESFGNKASTSTKTPQAYPIEPKLDEKPISVNLDASVKQDKPRSPTSAPTRSSVPSPSVSKPAKTEVKSTPVTVTKIEEIKQEPLVVRPKSGEAVKPATTPPAPTASKPGVEKTTIQPIMPKAETTKAPNKETVSSKPQTKPKVTDEAKAAPKIDKSESITNQSKVTDSKSTDKASKKTADKKPAEVHNETEAAKETKPKKTKAVKESKPATSSNTKQEDSATPSKTATIKTAETTENEDK